MKKMNSSNGFIFNDNSNGYMKKFILHGTKCGIFHSTHFSFLFSTPILGSLCSVSSALLLF